MGKSIRKQIIEFEGIAGCGKSTLCDNLSTMLKEQKITYIYSQELAKYMHTHPFMYVKTFRLNNYTNVLKLMISTRSLRSFKWYVAILKLLSLYEYYNDYVDKDILLCDHSLIQSVVQVWGYKEQIKLNSKSRIALTRFFQHYTDITNVYCNIGPEIAMQRIRSRNRKYGRLDMIKDDNELLILLKNNAYNLNEVLQAYKEAHHVLQCDMESEAGSIALNLFNNLRNLNGE